jgi:hypothetical protein
MSIKIIEATGEGDSQGAVLYCSTTEWAFGPVFRTVEDAQEFLVFCPRPRGLSDPDLESRYADFKQAQFSERSE